MNGQSYLPLIQTNRLDLPCNKQVPTTAKQLFQILFPCCYSLHCQCLRTHYIVFLKKELLLKDSEYYVQARLGIAQAIFSFQLRSNSINHFVFCFFVFFSSVHGLHSKIPDFKLNLSKFGQSKPN